jgi:hypothetical protein
MYKQIEKLAEGIRKNPDDIDGVVDYNSSEIIRLCQEIEKQNKIEKYGRESMEFVKKELGLK